MIDFAAYEDRGRSFTKDRLVRLSDADPRGTLRPDGVVRYLQDVATDDWDDVEIESVETWVVRRTALRVVAGGRWPTLGESVTMTTWCAGTGAAWAERRTNLFVAGQLMLEAVGLWVPVDPSGHPRRLSQLFYDVYGEAAGGRRVRGRVPISPLTSGAQRQPWLIRRSDLDVIGHVNNAALWCALSEMAPGELTSASMTHLGAVEGDDDVTLASDEGRLWLVVNGDVRVSGEFRFE